MVAPLEAGIRASTAFTCPAMAFGSAPTARSSPGAVEPSEVSSAASRCAGSTEAWPAAVAAEMAACSTSRLLVVKISAFICRSVPSGRWSYVSTMASKEASVQSNAAKLSLFRSSYSLTSGRRVDAVNAARFQNAPRSCPVCGPPGWTGASWPGARTHLKEFSMNKYLKIGLGAVVALLIGAPGVAAASASTTTAPALAANSAVRLAAPPTYQPSTESGFVPLTRCRIVDTRSGTGTNGTPFTSLATRTFYVGGTFGFAPQGGKAGG